MTHAQKTSDFFRLLIITSMLSAALGACGRSDLGRAPMPDSYNDEFQNWHKERLESLTNPTGWMRLAGLYWLEEGDNTFGSSDTVDIRFPKNTISGYAGRFILRDGQVVMQTAENVNTSHEGERVDHYLIYDGENSRPIESGSLYWLVIKRGDLTGIRLYNKENPQADAFNGFERYPINPDFYLKARFIPNQDSVTIPIANVLGQLSDSPSPGIVEFSIDGNIYKLDALDGSDRLFLIVGDLTNQADTYQAGRYLYIDYPEDGSSYTVIDFNKLYNPPCAYNAFSTCQLPPPQNRLDVALEAGEKRPVGWNNF